MKIRVNGEPREIEGLTTIADLLASLKLDSRFLAVEKNRELVPRTQHAQTAVTEGDEFEIVTLVGGG